jgi:hypothetical protein
MLETWEEKWNKANIYSAIFSELVCVVSKYPTKIDRNESLLLHNTSGPAIEWNHSIEFTKWSGHYVNGRNILQKHFDAIINQKYTIEDFINEPNEEQKSTCIALMQEKFGDEHLVRFFSKYLKEIDTFVDKKDEKYLIGTTGGMNVGVYALFKGEINNEDVAYIRCYCPSSDRMFFLGVDSDHNNAKDAIASLYRIPLKLKNHIKGISRQGERYSTTLTGKGKEILKSLSENEIADVTNITGSEYFNLIKYEF